MKPKLSLALALIVVGMPVTGGAQGTAPIDPAKAFGARERISDVALSPDGARVAMVMANGTRGQVVTVFDIGGDTQRSILSSDGDTDRIGGCHWSAVRRLVCTIVLRSETGTGALMFTRMVAIDADGGNMKLLSARSSTSALGLMQNGGTVIDWLADGSGDAAGGNVLMTRLIVPEASTGTHLAESRSGLAVERVNTITLKRTTVEQPRAESGEFITDGHGVVRVTGIQPQGSSGYNADRIVYSYRKPNSREWLPLSTLMLNGSASSGFNPYAVDRDLNVVYGFDQHQGRQALFRIKLDGSMQRELVHADPQVDVDGLVRIGRQNRVVGVSYATDRRQTVFFDPDLKKLGASLARALPNLPLVSFVDASADERKLVLFAGSDVDPGRYYLYDKDSRKLSELLPLRPELAAVTLAPVRAVTYPAKDGTMIPGYLTLPPGSDGKGLPAIVMPHGGPGARDEWGFDWLAQYFAQRGYAVLQPNFRGSTGYGDAWFQKNGFQSWATAVGDVNDGGRWLAAQGIAAKDRLAVVGWSYGGYAALQSPVLDPDLFKAIVAIAPVTDLETLRGEHRNFVDYPQVDAFIGRGPHVRAGSPAQNIAAIRAPVLMFHGDRDDNVGVGESRLMAARLRAAGKPVDYVELPKLDHQLRDDNVRADMLSRSDLFIRKALGL
ncbi:alpha/beta hydrolase family protein [Sphingomonas sp. Leaf25]|uniref:alpha/beta hydrolase family protein n=1 Tax=Sphingomonas sp. Leaf25 TaxID=1735692 RepID=UPI000A43B747|nr:S9 family peptidase [Sphingomonas sp. Leaf25]